MTDELLDLLDQGAVRDAVARVGDASDPDSAVIVRGWSATGAGNTVDATRALRTLVASLEALAASGDHSARRKHAHALLALGVAGVLGGEVDAGTAVLERALTLHTHAWPRAQCQRFCALALEYRGAWEGAAERYLAAAATYATIGHAYGQGSALYGAATALSELGDDARAWPLLTESVTALRAAGLGPALGAALGQLATLTVDRSGGGVEAMALLDEAEALTRDVPGSYAWDAKLRRAEVLLRLGQHAEALPWVEAAHEAVPVALSEAAWVDHLLARALLGLGRPDEARAVLDTAEATGRGPTPLPGAAVLERAALRLLLAATAGSTDIRVIDTAVEAIERSARARLHRRGVERLLVQAGAALAGRAGTTISPGTIRANLLDRAALTLHLAVTLGAPLTDGPASEGGHPAAEGGLAPPLALPVDLGAAARPGSRRASHDGRPPPSDLASTEDVPRPFLRALRAAGARIPLGSLWLEARIGRGGMGEVWRARHPNGREVAVKLLRGDVTREHAALFDAEVQAVARLDHPNIVRVLAAQRVDAVAAEMLAHEGGGASAWRSGTPAMVMELVRGGSLDAHMSRWRWTEARSLLADLLAALAHAHARGILHLDLKPGNVLIDDTSGERVPRLTDFGLAGIARRENTTHVFGTPAYMAPEQARPGAALGPATDLYAFGCLAWHLFTGRVPYPTTDVLEQLAQHQTARLPRLLPVHEVPDGLEGWLHTLLAKRPDQRFACAADAAFALSILGEPRRVGRGAPVVSSEPAEHTLDPADFVGETQPPPPVEGGASRATGSEGFEMSVNETLFPSNGMGTNASWESLPAPPTLWPGAIDGDLGGALAGKADVLPPGPGSTRQILLQSRVAPASMNPALRPGDTTGDERAAWMAPPEGSLSRGETAEVKPGSTNDAQGTRRPNQGGAARAPCLSPLAHGDPSAEPGYPRLAPDLVGLSASATGIRPRFSGDSRAPFRPDWRTAVRQDPLPFLPGVGEGLFAWRVGRLIGREAERDHLWAALGRVHADGRGRSVWIVGADGLGRSALLAWLTEAAHSTGAARIVRSVAAARAEGRPALLVLDDAEPAAAEATIAAVADTATLVVAAGRRAPEGADVVVLEPLTEPELAAIVDDRMPIDRGLAARLATRASGSPAFAVALLTDLVRRDALEPGPEGFRARPDVALQLPDDLRGLWSERLDVLAPPASPRRSAWELAALLGGAVPIAVWTEACGRAGLSVEPGVFRPLLDEGWISPEPGVFRFRVPALLEALRAGAAASGRAPTWHSAIADIYAHDEVVKARHLAAAGRHAEALGPLRSAAADAVNATRLEECRELIDLWDHSADALGFAPDDPRRASPIVVRVHLALHTHEDPYPLLERGLSLAAPDVECQLLYTLGWVQALDGRHAEAEVAYLRAITLADQIGSLRLRLAAMLGLAGAQYALGRDADPLIADTRARLVDREDLSVRLDACAGRGHLRLGEIRSAFTLLSRAILGARALGAPDVEAEALADLGDLYAVEPGLAASADPGVPTDTIACLASAVEALAGTGSDKALIARVRLAGALVCARRDDEARAALAPITQRFGWRLRPAEAAEIALVGAILEGGDGSAARAGLGAAADQPAVRRLLQEAEGRLAAGQIRE